jgi:hypothetical protein
MLKFYRLEARRILAGPKKMSTTLITTKRGDPASSGMKGIDIEVVKRYHPPDTALDD